MVKRTELVTVKPMHLGRASSKSNQHSNVVFSSAFVDSSAIFVSNFCCAFSNFTISEQQPPDGQMEVKHSS
jgi:hypothetical protein